MTNSGGQCVAIDGPWQSAEADNSGWGRRWKTMVASDDRQWQMRQAVAAAAADGGRHGWTMWLLATSNGGCQCGLWLLAAADGVSGGKWWWLVMADGGRQGRW